MKRLAQLAFILAAAYYVSGCSLVGCDRVFPHLTWYWSAEAKRCRQDKEMEKAATERWIESQRTNTFSK